LKDCWPIETEVTVLPFEDIPGVDDLDQEGVRFQVDPLLPAGAQPRKASVPPREDGRDQLKARSVKEPVPPGMGVERSTGRERCSVPRVDPLLAAGSVPGEEDPAAIEHGYCTEVKDRSPGIGSSLSATLVSGPVQSV